MTIKGILIPIGGNEDKGPEVSEGYNLDFVKDGILSRVVKESGGTDAKIVIIPTASSIPDEVADNYIKAFTELGCKNLTILKIKKPKHSEKKQYIKAITEADCVMFSGGDQSKIAECISNSTIHHILQDRYKNDKIVIAGTSAGAMAMSHQMIASGSVRESLLKGSVMMSTGLGLVPELIIDTHFVKRGRFGRVAEALAKFPNLLGIGLAEDTGLVIKNGNQFTVIGSGMAIIFDSSELTHNNFNLLEEGTPMTIANLRVHILANSDKFTISDKKLIVLPIDAPFE